MALRITLLVLTFGLVAACSTALDAAFFDDVSDVFDEAVVELRAEAVAVVPPAPPEPATLRRRELTTSSWLPGDRTWLAATVSIFAARLDLEAVPRFTPISVWTIGDAVVAAEVRVDGAKPLMAIPAQQRGVVAFYDDDGGAFAGPFQPRPVDYHYVSSPWGKRVHPISGKTRKHLGVDLSASTGTPVVSVADGVVVTKASNGHAGNHVAVRHPGGVTTRYFHLDAFADGLVVGRRVKRGEAVGVVGATGAVTGPHLHFERWQHGRCTDPGTPWPAGTRLPKKLRKEHKAVAATLRAMTEEDRVLSWPPAPPSTSTSTAAPTT